MKRWSKSHRDRYNNTHPQQPVAAQRIYMLPAARSMLPASQLARTTVRLCTTSRYEWQTLASGLRWKQVCVSLRLSPWPGHSRLLHGRSQVAHGNQGDHPVGDNQTVRISYSARVDETDTEVVSNRVASFKVGTRSQVLRCRLVTHAHIRRITWHARGAPGTDLRGA